MDSSFSKSRASFLEFAKQLSCQACHELALNPYVLGQCDHTFCLNCADALADRSCPVCGAETLAEKGRPDHVVEKLIEAFMPVARFFQLPLAQPPFRKITENDVPKQCTSHEVTSLPAIQSMADDPTQPSSDGNRKNIRGKKNLGTPGTSTDHESGKSLKSTPATSTSTTTSRRTSNKNKLTRNPQDVESQSCSATIKKSRERKTSLSSIDASCNGGAKEVPTSATASTSLTEISVGDAEKQKPPTKKKMGDLNSSHSKKRERKNSLDSLNSSINNPDNNTTPIPTKNNCLDYSFTSSTPNISSKLHRRNAKGETPLQVACVRQDVDRVKELLALGADPNTQDNAGWTPLHDAVSMGKEAIAELLLKGGANPNVPGGQGNETPLHDAVFIGKINMVRLLLSHGADLNARNSRGLTPVDLCPLNDEEIKSALSASVVGPPVPKPLDRPKLQSTQAVHLHPLNTEKKTLTKLGASARALGFKLLANYSNQVTHVAVRPEDGSVKSNALFYSAVLQGHWICDLKWIEESEQAGHLTDPSPHEMDGRLNRVHPNGAPSRLNATKQLPGLFNNCSFFLYGTFSAGGLTKQDVTAWIKHGGGQVLTRSPNPESISPSKKVPYHARVDGPLAKCCHFILYDPKNPPALKYNMAHVKTLPLDWLIASIESFTLADPF